jgi:hypothetical protein
LLYVSEEIKKPYEAKKQKSPKLMSMQHENPIDIVNDLYDWNAKLTAEPVSLKKKGRYR